MKYAPLVLRLNYTSELGDNFEYKICKNSNAIHDLWVNNAENAQKYPKILSNPLTHNCKLGDNCEFKICERKLMLFMTSA